MRLCTTVRRVADLCSGVHTGESSGIKLRAIAGVSHDACTKRFC